MQETRGVQGDDAGGEEAAVEAVRQRVGAERGGDQPERVDALAAVQREHGQAGGAEQGCGAQDQHLGGGNSGRLRHMALSPCLDDRAPRRRVQMGGSTSLGRFVPRPGYILTLRGIS